MIPALAINRHAILLADSDRRKSDDKLKSHTARLAEEVDKTGYAWITKGREVENYIPEGILLGLCGAGVAQPSEYDSVLEVIATQRGVETVKKVALAYEVVEKLTREMLDTCSDMRTHLDTICSKLKVWNRLE